VAGAGETAKLNFGAPEMVGQRGEPTDRPQRIPIAIGIDLAVAVPRQVMRQVGEGIPLPVAIGVADAFIPPGERHRLEGDTASPELGYPYAKQLLSRNAPFTALFAYNDSLAIGAIRAIHEAGLRVPQDISVVGFDDILSAAYCNPPLTTVRQPLEKMGEIAARTLLDRIENRNAYVPEIAIEPEFVIRKSTAPPRKEVLQEQKDEALLVSSK